MKSNMSLIVNALKCRCPRCHKGALFQSRFSLDMNETCSSCDFAMADNDVADGPAFFLIFFLGFALVPLALMFEHFVAPPLWAHAVIWGTLALGLTLGGLKPLKAYIMALQTKYDARNGMQDDV